MSGSRTWPTASRSSRVAADASELPDRQREVYEAVVGQVERLGYQPTVKEMAERFGVWPKAVRDRVGQLVSRGYLGWPDDHAQERRLALPHLRFDVLRTEPLSKTRAVAPEVAEVFYEIIRSICECGYQPTTVEMAEALGLNKATVAGRLERLEEAGLVRRPGGKTERRLGLPGLAFVAKLKAP